MQVEQPRRRRPDGTALADELVAPQRLRVVGPHEQPDEDVLQSVVDPRPRPCPTKFTLARQALASRSPGVVGNARASNRRDRRRSADVLCAHARSGPPFGAGVIRSFQQWMSITTSPASIATPSDSLNARGAVVSA